MSISCLNPSNMDSASTSWGREFPMRTALCEVKPYTYLAQSSGNKIMPWSSHGCLVHTYLYMGHYGQTMYSCVSDRVNKLVVERQPGASCCTWIDNQCSFLSTKGLLGRVLTVPAGFLHGSIVRAFDGLKFHPFSSSLVTVSAFGFYQICLKLFSGKQGPLFGRPQNCL